MPVITTEISVFQPGARKKEAVITSLIPKQAVDALGERLGQEAADTANKALRNMKTLDSDLIQFRIGERRVRIRQVA